MCLIMLSYNCNNKNKSLNHFTILVYNSERCAMPPSPCTPSGVSLYAARYHICTDSLQPLPPFVCPSLGFPASPLRFPHSRTYTIGSPAPFGGLTANVFRFNLGFNLRLCSWKKTRNSNNEKKTAIVVVLFVSIKFQTEKVILCFYSNMGILKWRSM